MVKKSRELFSILVSVLFRDMLQTLFRKLLQTSSDGKRE